jgi:DNA-binding winged helix-turn-helix (wHTH) protein/Tol biopolymer transport system component
VIYRFGGFELEPDRRSLRFIATAEPVALTAKLFDLLVYLIEHRGRLVEKQELLDAVWPNVVVEEANLPQTISVLRRALGEDRKAHEYIATIPGRGYQFVASVEVVEPQSGTSADEPGTGPALRDTSGALESPPRATPWAGGARAAWQPSYLLAAGLVGAALAGGLVFTLTRPVPPPQPVSRYLVTPPATAPLSSLGGVDLEISPDGTRLAYFSGDAQSDGLTLYLRDLAELDARPVPGSEGTTINASGHPFFSADGKWVGFWSPGQGIMRAAVSGGPPQKMLDDPPIFFGAAWAADDTVILSSGYGLLRATAGGGGTPELLTGTMERGDAFHVAPVLLPGARAVLFTLIEGNFERIAVFDMQTRERKILIEDAQNASYAATGHIVCARGTTLLAQPFDVERLLVTGEPVALLHDVRNPGVNTAADYALSATGTLAYVPAGVGATATGTPVWVDRSGRIGEDAVGEQVESAREPRLSPDGLRLVLTAGPFDDGNLWIYDLGGRLPILLAEPGDNRSAVWSPDGAKVAFTSNRGGSYDLYAAPADGSVADPPPLRAYGLAAAPAVWSAAGELILDRSGAGGDIVATGIEPGSEVREVAATTGAEFNPALSPNGRWLAFASDRTGRLEIWVKRYPDGVPVRVSRDGVGPTTAKSSSISNGAG